MNKYEALLSSYRAVVLPTLRHYLNSSKISKEEGISINQFISTALAEKMSALRIEGQLSHSNQLSKMVAVVRQKLLLEQRKT